MGGGTYSISSRAARAETLGYAHKSAQEIFQARSINNSMDPHGVTIRESRDSEEHPHSIAIVLALDETGSMGTVPHYLVKEGLPHMMADIYAAGVNDPQVLFLGIGDHECDSSPLQVGQFESSDALMDKWLTDLYLEGRGGGNAGESYLLAWYFAAFHTAIDCFEKRGKKGYLFTVGDEPTLPTLPEAAIRSLMGVFQASTYSAAELLEEASKKYEVYHIHVKETRSGQRKEVMDGWAQLIQDHLVIAERREEIPGLICKIIAAGQAGVAHHAGPAAKPDAHKPKTEEMML